MDGVLVLRNSKTILVSKKNLSEKSPFFKKAFYGPMGKTILNMDQEDPKAVKLLVYHLKNNRLKNLKFLKFYKKLGFDFLYECLNLSEMMFVPSFGRFILDQLMDLHDFYTPAEIKNLMYLLTLFNKDDRVGFILLEDGTGMCVNKDILGHMNPFFGDAFKYKSTVTILGYPRKVIQEVIFFILGYPIDLTSLSPQEVNQYFRIGMELCAFGLVNDLKMEAGLGKSFLIPYHIASRSKMVFHNKPVPLGESMSKILHEIPPPDVSWAGTEEDALRERRGLKRGAKTDREEETEDEDQENIKEMGRKRRGEMIILGDSEKKIKLESGAMSMSNPDVIVSCETVTGGMLSITSSWSLISQHPNCSPEREDTEMPTKETIVGICFFRTFVLVLTQDGTPWIRDLGQWKRAHLPGYFGQIKNLGLSPEGDLMVTTQRENGYTQTYQTPNLAFWSFVE